MALHPLKLPKAARQLFKIVALQKRLLRALADPALNATAVDATWVKSVWHQVPPTWVDKFCRRGQIERIRIIAGASATARLSLYEEFSRQNKVLATCLAGGDFRDIATLPGFNDQLATSVKDFFEDCYDLLGQSSRTKGYHFAGRVIITKLIYSDAFCEAGPTQEVCPYCDGSIGNPVLDHYYCKSKFPLLACSPWNLVPICDSCNKAGTGKGDRIALDPGPPRSCVGWLHPFHSPASIHAYIRLDGNPRKAIPSLRSPDAPEQKRLDNHICLLDCLDHTPPSRWLTKRWTRTAAVRFDVLVRQVNEQLSATVSRDALVQRMLQDQKELRGQLPGAMVHAGVCRAVLEQRAEYVAEFSDSNPPKLA